MCAFALDINECDREIHNCGALEDCRNTVGSFLCLCTAGYQRSGIQCIGEFDMCCC